MLVSRSQVLRALSRRIRGLVRGFWGLISLLLLKIARYEIFGPQVRMSFFLKTARLAEIVSI
jgi:hypothetical protein